MLILYCNCNLQVAYGIANNHISTIIILKKSKIIYAFHLHAHMPVLATSTKLYTAYVCICMLLYTVCSHIEEWISVFTFILCVALCTHTKPKYWYEAETLISFHSDTWFPWETCDVTWEQRGTWTQPTVYLQHMPLLIKDN